MKRSLISVVLLGICIVCSEGLFYIQKGNCNERIRTLQARKNKLTSDLNSCQTKPKPIWPIPVYPPSPQECVGAKIDLVFVLDASSSITTPNFELMRKFLHDFLSIASIDNGDVRVGLVIFSTQSHIQFNLKDYNSKSGVLNAIDNVPYKKGRTNTASGLLKMRKMFRVKFGDRRRVKNMAIVITDGVSNVNAKKTIPMARRARARGIHIYAIGIGLSKTKELNKIASRPVKKNRFTVQDFTELRTLRDKIFRSICINVNKRPKPRPQKPKPKPKPQKPDKSKCPHRCASPAQCEELNGKVFVEYPCPKGQMCCKPMP
ncbi:matrilin-2-like [Gigantopelta aegis]|uniref:matrilin-2-like n=1 Tax=Gigantopelta aegis TaxID=1735272 RepID=UPI001B888D3F|nr:matrilin-2-like [Gigantopelta aegis]